jgi:hypothetical protein
VALKLLKENVGRLSSLSVVLFQTSYILTSQEIFSYLRHRVLYKATGLKRDFFNHVGILT